MVPYNAAIKEKKEKKQQGEVSFGLLKSFDINKFEVSMIIYFLLICFFDLNGFAFGYRSVFPGVDFT